MLVQETSLSEEHSPLGIHSVADWELDLHIMWLSLH